MSGVRLPLEFWVGPWYKGVPEGARALPLILAKAGKPQDGWKAVRNPDPSPRR